MNGLLVIGYGNSLRGDDGAGPEAARLVGKLDLPGVTVIECHQLLPEHAEVISQVGRVVFIDAHVDLPPGRIEVGGVSVSENPQLGSHASDPESLLALSKALYDRVPEATLIAIPARDFELREGLSDLAADGVAQAIDAVGRLHAGIDVS
jgi:hydrogenase maturation protease